MMNLEDFMNEDENPSLKIARLEVELEESKQESQKNWEALVLLMSICKQKNFDPFAGEALPLNKHPENMTREELVARNKEVTARIESNKSSNTTEKLSMPNEEQKADLYKSQQIELSSVMQSLLNSITSET